MNLALGATPRLPASPLPDLDLLDRTRFAALGMLKAQGCGDFDMQQLRDTLPAFTSLTQEHIALEELLLYPAARRRLSARRNGDD